MNADRIITLLIILFPLVMCLQLAYGLIVREPYPSFMMPGFSRIDNDGKAYKLIDRKIIQIDKTNDTIIYNLDILNTSVSKIAISRMIDLAFFNPANAKTENSAQKKYYGIIKSVMGADNYKKYVVDIRYPPVKKESIVTFRKWFVKQLAAHLGTDYNQLMLRRIEETRDFKSGKTISTRTIDEITLTDD